MWKIETNSKACELFLITCVSFRSALIYIRNTYVLRMFDLSQLIYEATWLTLNSNSLIDHIYAPAIRRMVKGHMVLSMSVLTCVCVCPSIDICPGYTPEQHGIDSLTFKGGYIISWQCVPNKNNKYTPFRSQMLLAKILNHIGYICDTLQMGIPYRDDISQRKTELQISLSLLM